MEISLYRSKELRELVARMEHQSPHLLDTMEQVISFLHADWQQLKRDCDNLHNKLKRWVCYCYYGNRYHYILYQGVTSYSRASDGV